MNADDAARKAFFVARFVERYGREPSDDGDLLLYLRQVEVEDESRIADLGGLRSMADLVARVLP